jgi:hypothetical protein
MSHRRFLVAVIVAAAAGCQQLLGLDPGNQSSSGPGGTGATATTASTSTGLGGATSTSISAGGATASTTTATSTSSGSTGATTTTTGTTTTTTTGAGGGNPCTTAFPVPITDMIDTLEHGGDSIPVANGRCGTWFTYNDGTGPAQTPSSNMVFPSMPGYCSASAMHTTGGPFTAYGGGIGFDLNSCASGPRKPYNASTHKGVAFWAKSSNAADAASPIYFMILEPATVAAGGTGGGTCTPGDAGGQCGDSHEYSVQLTTEWHEFSPLFTDMLQAGWGINVGALDPSQILAMQFNVPVGQAFDFWVDDIGFY